MRPEVQRSHELQQSQERIDARLCEAVSRRLGVTPEQVWIMRRDVLKNGATVPVFAVPMAVIHHAGLLGLSAVSHE